MNPELKAFLDSISSLRAKANAMLSGLPPMEQFEASSELSYGFRCLTRMGNEMVEFADNLAKALPELEAKIVSMASAEAKTKLLTSGEFVAKADHDAALTAAANTRETEVRGAITAEAAGAAKIEARRKQIVDSKILPLVSAEKLPAAMLADDNFLVSAGAVKHRLAKLVPFGITAEKAPLVVASVSEFGLDAAGEAEFNGRFKVLEQAATVGRGGVGSAANPLAGAGTAGAAAAASAEAATEEETSGYRRRLL